MSEWSGTMLTAGEASYMMDLFLPGIWSWHSGSRKQRRHTGPARLVAAMMYARS